MAPIRRSRYKAAHTKPTVRIDWHEAEDFLKSWLPEDYTYAARYRRWHGGNARKMYAGLRKGDLTHVETAEKLIDEVDSLVDISTYGPTWSPHVVGSSPRVAAWLQGAPNSMNRYQRQLSPMGEMNVYVGTASSGFVNDEQLVRKGVAVAALVLMLQRFRPVNLWIYDTSYFPKTRTDTCLAIRVSTAPLDLGALLFATTTTAMARGYMHNAAAKIAGLDPIPKEERTSYDCGQYDTIQFSKELAPTLLGVDEDGDDLIVAANYGTDFRECIADPVKWVGKHVRLALKREGAAYADAFAEYEAFNPAKPG